MIPVDAEPAQADGFFFGSTKPAEGWGFHGNRYEPWQLSTMHRLPVVKPLLTACREDGVSSFGQVLHGQQPSPWYKTQRVAATAPLQLCLAVFRDFR